MAIKIKKILVRLLAVLLLGQLLLSLPAVAESISQGYQTSDPNLSVGMAVSLVGNKTEANTFVEQSTLSNSSRFVGIVTTINANLLTLTNKSATVYVSTLGETTALVSDANGAIKKGDFLTISPLNGILMRSDLSGSSVVGSALEDFNTSTASSQTIKHKDGSTQQAKVGSLKISLNSSGANGATKKPFLILFGQSITGKEVNQWQVISALGIFFVLLTVEGSIIYGAVHSAIIAMGRNPLAKGQVYKQLFQVFWLLLIVLVFGGGTIYAVLWA